MHSTGIAETSRDYHLARIGDAAAHRNVHTALHDALRVCKDL